MIFGLNNAVDDPYFSCITWNGNKERLEDGAIIGADGDDRVVGWIDFDDGLSLLQLNGLR